jgi:peptidoglycan/xylan/chitin deacetylase (PgdA/CDA1 family)
MPSPAAALAARLPSLPLRDTMVLCYHAISPTWPMSQSLPEEALAAQLDLLLRRGYEPVTFTEAATTPSRGRRVAVTFDDGYTSVLRAAELMAERGVPGTLFVVSDAMGGSAAWLSDEEIHGAQHRPETRLMGWDDVRGLAAQGWEIGSHTRTHVHLTRCDDAQLDDELAGSRARVGEELGRPCTSIAFPFGDMDSRVVQATRRAGYGAAGALPVRTTAPDPYAFPRIGVYHRDADHPWHFRLKVSPAARALRRSPAWSAYGAARRKLTGR